MFECVTPQVAPELDRNALQAFSYLRELFVIYDHGGHSARSTKSRLLEAAIFGSKYSEANRQSLKQFSIEAAQNMLRTKPDPAQAELYTKLRYLPEEVLAALAVKVIQHLNTTKEWREFVSLREQLILASASHLLNSDFFAKQVLKSFDATSPEAAHEIINEYSRRQTLRLEKEMPFN